MKRAGFHTSQGSRIPAFTQHTHTHTERGRHTTPICIPPYIYDCETNLYRVLQMQKAAASVQGYREPKGHPRRPRWTLFQRFLPHPSFYGIRLNHIHWIIVHFNWMIIETGRDRFIGERYWVIYPPLSSNPGWGRGPAHCIVRYSSSRFFFRHSLYYDYRIMIVLNQINN